MTVEGLLWVVGAYLLGTLPSTYLVSRARRATDVLRLSARGASEADAHVLMDKHLGKGWAALAATLDVAKGFGPLAVRHVGGLSEQWVALAGVAAVLGHGWPPYARAMAGRGLSTASGVYLALLPIEMVVAGILIVAGFALRLTGPASTLGFAVAPVIAVIEGQPAALVSMAVAVFFVIVLRRLEGVQAVVAGGVSWPRALWYRAVHDVSAPPEETGAAEREAPPETLA